MNLLSPGDILLAVRRRSVCSVVTPAAGKSGDDCPKEEPSPAKKEKRRRNSISEATPQRRMSFFHRSLIRVGFKVFKAFLVKFLY